LKIHLNIIFPSRFPHQNPVHASALPHPSYMPRPSHSSLFYHPHNSGWGVQIMELLIMKFSPQLLTVNWLKWIPLR
jgi:hypothetical protein